MSKRLHRTNCVSKVVFVCALTAMLVFRGTAAAQQGPVHREKPFDLITLKKGSGGAQIKVLPIEFPDRKVPENPSSADMLTVRLLEKPRSEYRVAWKDIDRVDLFEQMVLKEAESFVRKREYDAAYRAYSFLLQEYPQLPQLKSAVESFWIAEASTSFQKQRYEEAIMLLDQVFDQNPRRNGLDRAMARVYEQIVMSQMESRDYARARQILQSIKVKYGDRLNSLQAKWNDQLAEIAAKELELARTRLSSGDLPEAYQLAHRAASIWPDAQDAVLLLDQIAQRYPIVRVAVEPVLPARASRIDDWASARISRLTSPHYVQFTGVSSEGGDFSSELIDVQVSQDRRQLTIDLSRLADFDGPDGYSLAQQLADASNRRSDHYDASLTEAVEQLDVQGIYRVKLTLRRPHLLAASLIERLIRPSGRLPLFQVLTGDSSEVRYLSNLNAPKPPRIREIVERPYQVASQAVAALETNEVDVIDRVFPAYVPRLRSNAELTVGSYRIPTVHALALNQDRPILASRTFRRALCYAINRPLILQQEILGGQTVNACETISGPFPIGKSNDDALGYAYDLTVKTRSYNPKVALTLKEIALREISLTDDTNLTLVHPPSEIARIACQRIGKSLETIGIDCEVKEATEQDLTSAAGDLLYKEITLREPLVDVHRLFGPDGIIPHRSSHLSLALRVLSEAEDWQGAAAQLQRIHKLIHDELVVIPLWQINEHYAYRNLAGIGTEPVSLYQNIRAWAPKQP